MNINATKPGAIHHEIRVIPTKNVFEAFNLEYLESSGVSVFKKNSIFSKFSFKFLIGQAFFWHDPS